MGEIVEFIVDILVDVAEAIEDSELSEELTELSSELQTTATSVYQNAIDQGYEAEEASQQTVDYSYGQIQNIDQASADQWAFEMEQNTGYSPKNVDPNDPFEPENKYEDTDPESDPNKAEVDENDVVCEGTDCTTPCEDASSVECAEAKENAFGRFMKWMFSGSSIIGTIGVILAILAFVVGGIVRGICRLICWMRGTCSNSSSNCSCSHNCDTQLCNGFKSFVKFIRKYFWFIILGFILFGTFLFWYTLSIGKVITFSGIPMLIIYLMSTFLGNFVTTTVCNVSASFCFLQSGSAHCS